MSRPRTGIEPLTSPGLPGTMTAGRRNFGGGIAMSETRQLSPELLEILRCPHCVGGSAEPPAGVRKGELRLETDILRCLQCGRRYKVEDGIPDMIPEHAVLPDRS